MLKPETHKKRFTISYKTLTKIRYFILLSFLTEDLLILYAKKTIPLYLWEKIKYFTNWSHILTFLYFILASYQKSDHKKTKKLSIIFHMACSCQFVVTLVYWLVLHEEIIKTIDQIELYILCYTCHSLPFIYLIFDYFSNNLILQPKKALKFIVLFVFTYLGFLGFLELGFELELYPDITFKSFLKRYLYFGIYFGICFCSYLWMGFFFGT